MFYFQKFFIDNHKMPKIFKSIEEKREYERSRKKIQKENGLSNEKKEYILYSVHLKKNCEECCYVGITTNLSVRILKHKSASKREENAFYDYVKEKGGWENFYFNNVIHHKEITKTGILIYESYFIKFLAPLFNSVRPYISNSEYNRIASELEHPLLPEPPIPEPKIKKFAYRNNLPKFVDLNPIIDEEETRVYTIYKIECAKKNYVGLTHDPVERFLSHKENSQNRNINGLYDHIYDNGGWSNIKVTIELNDKMTKKRALLLESFFIRYLKAELNSLIPYISNTDFHRIKKQLNLP